MSTRRALPSPNPPRALFSRVISKITRALSAAEKGAGGPRHNASRNLAMTLASYGGLLCSAGAPLLCFLYFCAITISKRRGLRGCTSMHVNARAGEGDWGGTERARAQKRKRARARARAHTRARARTHTHAHTHTLSSPVGGSGIVRHTQNLHEAPMKGHYSVATGHC